MSSPNIELTRDKCPGHPALSCQSCQSCSAQSCRAQLILSCHVVQSRVVPSSFSQCRLTTAHACARLERRVGRVLRTLVGGHSITSISSALSFSRRFHRTFEQRHGNFSSSSASGEFIDVCDLSSRAIPRDGMKVSVICPHHILLSRSNVDCLVSLATV